MKFHVGDFVKTRRGLTGYINKIGGDHFFSWKCVSGPYNFVGKEFTGNTLFHDFCNEFEQVGATVLEQKYKPIEHLDRCSDVPSEYTSCINEIIDAVNKINEQLAKEQ